MVLEVRKYVKCGIKVLFTLYGNSFNVEGRKVKGDIYKLGLVGWKKGGIIKGDLKFLVFM